MGAGNFAFTCRQGEEPRSIFILNAISVITELVAPYESPASDMTLDETLTGKFVIGVHNSRAVDSQFACQSAPCWQPYTFSQVTGEDRFAQLQANLPV